jgi:hypothetical protein
VVESREKYGYRLKAKNSARRTVEKPVRYVAGCKTKKKVPSVEKE